MCYSEGLAMPGVLNMAPMWCHRETKTNEGSLIVYITEKLARQYAQNATSGLFATASLACWGWPADFISLYLFNVSIIQVFILDSDVC